MFYHLVKNCETLCDLCFHRWFVIRNFVVCVQTGVQLRADG